MDGAEGEAQVSPLDKEITSLKKQAANLRKTLRIECSTILSNPSIRDALLSSLNPPPTPKSAALRPRKPRRTSIDRDEQRLLTRSKQQEAYDQQCLYRIAASVTAFKVRDPDPNAVDGGHVLGLRFEAMTRGQFLQPYYVMLNRPYPDNRQFLRVHRHTVPPAIPLSGLAARFLPGPKKQQQEQEQQAEGRGDDSPSPSSLPPQHLKQDLERFVKSLRREIMRYHNRLGVSADLRRSLGAHSKKTTTPPNAIVDVSIADTEAKQIRLTWADERNGRLVMDDDGKVVKFVVFGAAESRDWETTRQLGDSEGRVEDIAKMLEEYASGTS
ncbi:Cenp-O kinetochore centromere component domain-containing protein [Trichoderma evansii]